MFRKRYKPVSGMVAAFVLISILVCSVFTAFPHDVKAESENNYLDSAITYQGEENWYNYSGDFSENQLINMFYIQRYGMWQGQSELNRIYNDTLVQVPTADYDAMRAYVVILQYAELFLVSIYLSERFLIRLSRRHRFLNLSVLKGIWRLHTITTVMFLKTEKN